MTDPSQVSNPQRRPRRSPRLGDSGAPVTTVAVLTVAAIAVIAGFLILRTITDPSVGSQGTLEDVAPTAATAAPTSTTGTSPDTTTSTTSTTSTTTTTTTPSVSKSDATIVVANASGIDRSATAMAAQLAFAGYTTAPVANATGPRLEQSLIYYVEGDPAALGVARLLAEEIPTARALPMPKPPPLDRPLNAATVALMVGRDIAGRSLAELKTG